MDTNNIPGYLIPEVSETEFFSYHGTILCFRGGKQETYLSPEDLPEDICNIIIRYLNRNRKYRTGLQAMGCETEKEEIFQFIKCKLINNDSKSNIDAQGNINEEFVPCPFAGHCIGEKFICKRNEENLTKREIQIIGLVAQDLADKQISARLGTTKNTVRNQINVINRKLGTYSKMGIVRFAVQNNLL